jgi:hypothetical protein
LALALMRLACDATASPSASPCEPASAPPRCTLSHVLSQPSPATTSELVLEHAFAAPVADVARLRIDTQRPGWVIWYEIEVLGEP